MPRHELIRHELVNAHFQFRWRAWKPELGDGPNRRLDNGIRRPERGLTTLGGHGFEQGRHLRLVLDREYPSGEIAARFPDVSGPAVSQHLRVLREAGLISERRSGTRRLYRARPEGLAQLRGVLREFWGDGLSQLKSAAEDQQRRKGTRRGGK